MRCNVGTLQEPFIFRTKSSSSVFTGERPQLLRESAVAPRGTPAGFPRREPDHAQGGNPLRSFG